MQATIGVRERNKAERRRRIKEAALAAFTEKGYDRATTREIAKLAGVAQGTLFLYARDKRDLLLMVINDDLEMLTSSVFASLHAGAPLLEALMHLFRARYEYWGARPEFSLHALDDSFYRKTGERSSVEMTRYAFQRAMTLHSITEIVRSAQARTEARADEDATHLAWVILSIFVTSIRAWLREPKPDLAHGLGELSASLRTALRGIAPPAAPLPPT
jgi:AcrR family transcriptional regulator